jgi:hypothetical protein
MIRNEKGCIDLTSKAMILLYVGATLEKVVGCSASHGWEGWGASIQVHHMG